MPIPIVPDTFVRLLAACAGCFPAPSYRNFAAVVAGWVHCLGRRTVTAVALAAGVVGDRHISVFHRFFGRAVWTLDRVGQVLFTLAVAWVPAGQPLYVLVDDTLARKGGKHIALAAMHHDPLRSTAKKPFFSFGHVWVVVALWVPLPMGGARRLALPILVRLSAGRKRGGQADAPSRPGSAQRRTAAADDPDPVPGPTKLELAREMVGLVAGWAGDQPVSVVADSLYAGRTLLDNRPANVHVVTRLRMDAALWALPPPRRSEQKGRPRRRCARLPSPQALATARQHWHRLPVTLYGRAVTTQVFRRTALWYAAVPGALVRIVVVRDPAGHRKDAAFVCTDPTASAAFILEAFARRWTLRGQFPRYQTVPRVRGSPGPDRHRRPTHGPAGPARLRPGRPLVRRGGPRWPCRPVDRPSLVSPQEHAVVRRHARRPASRRMAPFCLSATVTPTPAQYIRDPLA